MGACDMWHGSKIGEVTINWVRWGRLLRRSQMEKQVQLVNKKKVKAQVGNKGNRKSLKNKLGGDRQIRWRSQEQSYILSTRELEDPREYVLENPGVCLPVSDRVTIEDVLLKPAYLRETKAGKLHYQSLWQSEKQNFPLEMAINTQTQKENLTLYPVT